MEPTLLWYESAAGIHTLTVDGVAHAFVEPYLDRWHTRVIRGGIQTARSATLELAKAEAERQARAYHQTLR